MTPLTQKTLLTDKNHIWHPFTQMKDYETLNPPVIQKARGLFLYDTEGNRYYDTISSWWTNLLGHGNKKIRKAVAKQMKTLDHVNFSGFTHPAAAGLVEELKPLLPASLSRFFFSDNGSTAVEVALKTAFQYFQNQGQTQKTRFAFLSNSYHGDTLGAVSVGGVETFHELYRPLLFESFKAEGPHCPSCPHKKSPFTQNARQTGCEMQCFASMEQILNQNLNQIAAVVLEPLLQGSGGMLIYPPAYLKKLKALCEKLNILLIFDEVATGFGRTGTLFALEQAGVAPDILCLSKGITGGTLPLGLTVCSEKIYEAFYDDYSAGKTFYHGHSYTANPVICSAAIATLKQLKKKNLPLSAEAEQSYFHETLMQTFQEKEWIADIRYLGFIAAVDVVKSRKQNQSFAPEKRMGFKIFLEGLKHGVVLRPLGDTHYWYLPLTVKQKDLKEIFKRSLKAMEKTVLEEL